MRCVSKKNTGFENNLFSVFFSVDEFVSVSKDKYSYNVEQALGMFLFLKGIYALVRLYHLTYKVIS